MIVSLGGGGGQLLHYIDNSSATKAANKWLAFPGLGQYTDCFEAVPEVNIIRFRLGTGCGIELSIPRLCHARQPTARGGSVHERTVDFFDAAKLRSH